MYLVQHMRGTASELGLRGFREGCGKCFIFGKLCTSQILHKKFDFLEYKKRVNFQFRQSLNFLFLKEICCCLQNGPL